MNRRKKESAEGKPADANAKKDDKKPAKKPCKKGKRGREPSASTSLPVLPLSVLSSVTYGCLCLHKGSL